jgi:tetratricopeptide (TPR) repeat protein
LTACRSAPALLLWLAAATGAFAQLDKARRAELAGNLPAAEQAYETELKLRPAADTWQRLGLVRHLQNKYKEAIPAFREAVRLNPALWTSHLFLGICLYRTNQFADALAALEQAARHAPRDHPGREELDYWLGATHIARKRPLAGLRILEGLLARNPKHVAALELAVQTYTGLGSALWNEVAEEHFESPAGYEVHGNALESERNPKAALEAYRISKALAPQRPGPGLAIGRLLLLEGRAEEALAGLEHELRLAPGDPETSFYAGLAAIQLGRLHQAASWLETAARWPEQLPEAPLALAQVYLALGENAKAVQAARQAVAIAPSLASAHELLIAALSQAGLEGEIETERRRWQARQRERQ